MVAAEALGPPLSKVSTGRYVSHGGRSLGLMVGADHGRCLLACFPFLWDSFTHFFNIFLFLVIREVSKVQFFCFPWKAMEIFQNPNVSNLVDIVFSQDSARNSSSEECAIDTLDPLRTG